MIILLNKKFLVADKQRYRRLCLSVRRSVGPLVMIEAKSGKKSILDTFQACLCVDQVCQLRVMTEFETITLTQGGAIVFKTTAVFLFSKIPWATVFSRGHATQHLAVSVGRYVGRSVRPSHF